MTRMWTNAMLALLGVFAWARADAAIPLQVKVLPNPFSGDGYTVFATDPFGHVQQSLFDPWDPGLPAGINYGPKGIAWTSLFLYQGNTVRQALTGLTTFYGTSVPLTADSLLIDEFVGSGERIRHTRFLVPTIPDLQVDLYQDVDCDMLTQRYVFSNTGEAPLSIRLLQYSDWDFDWGMNFLNDWGYHDAADPYSSSILGYDRLVSLVHTVVSDPAMVYEGWRITGDSWSGVSPALKAPMTWYGYPPSQLNNAFMHMWNNWPFDTNNDGWTDYKGDVGLGFQAFYTIEPDQPREWVSKVKLYPSAAICAEPPCLDEDGDGYGVGENTVRCTFPGVEDRCPTDADKVEPGICGCDVPDSDVDLDGVMDCMDECLDTPVALVIDTAGCSGVQRVRLACNGEMFKNHGQYVSCVVHAANAARDAGLLTQDERTFLVTEAAQSDIGK